MTTRPWLPKSGPTRSFEFQFSREDHRAYVIGTTPRWWEFPARWPLAAVIALGAILGLAEGYAGADIPQSVVVLILCAAFVGAGLAGRTLSIRRALARFSPSAAPILIEIGEDGVVVTRDGAARSIPWNDFVGVGLSDGHVELGVARPDDRIVIPLHAFADRADMNAFFGECENRLHDDDGAANEHGPIPEAPLPDQPKTVAVTLRADDWTSAQKDMNPGRPLPLDRAALFTTIFGGVITGGLATVYTAIAGRSLDFMTWAAFAWPGAIALTWIGGRAYENAQRKLRNDLAAHMRSYEIAIDAHGLTRRAKGVNTHLDWSTISGVELKGGNILFSTHWSEFFIAPRHGFADEKAFKDFFAAARAWRRAAEMQDQPPG